MGSIAAVRFSTNSCSVEFQKGWEKMAGLKKGLLVCLALAALFAGSFAATLFVGRSASASGAPTVPAAKQGITMFSAEYSATQNWLCFFKWKH